MKHFTTLLLGCFLSLASFSQVGIGTTSPNSTLDIRGSLAAATRSFTGATAIVTSDHTLIFTGTSAATATLPDASTCAGREYCLKNFSTTIPVPVLTVATVSSQTIDKAGSWLLDQTYESVTLISDGSNWAVADQVTPSGSGNSWVQGGNNVTSMQSIGTTTNYSLPFLTNNAERMRITNTGNVGIGSTSFSSSPEALLVYQNSSTSFNVIGGKGSLNNYLQLNIQNQSGGNAASSDLVATANNGNETTNYVDLGINSSGYNQSGILGGHNLCYLFGAGNDFAIGNSVSGQNLIFFVDGTATTNERMRIATGGNVGIGSTAPASTLQVGGSFAAAITVKTASYTATAGDHTILCNNTAGAITLSLPTATDCAGRMYVIKKISGAGNNVIVAGYNGTETVDGSTTYTITSQYTAVVLQSDGANWYILSGH